MADIFLRKEPGYFKDLSDENIPVIKELASVLAGYYVTALNNSFGTNYELSEPFLSVNPYRAIEDFDFGPVYIEEIHVLMFKASFNIAQERIKKDIVLLFREESTKELLEMISSKISFVKD
jgi:chemotaxis protein CheY-P-specific phosphatase CheC